MTPKKTYSLKLKSLPVQIANTAGVEETYEIREMVAEERDKHMEFMNERTIMEGGEVVGFKKIEGLHVDLLKRVLFRGNGSIVTDKELNKWPASLVADLYREAQTLNGLNKSTSEQQEEAKNA